MAMLLALVATWCLQDGFSIMGLTLALLLGAPLWLALPGLHRGTRRAYAWSSLALAFYLALALMETVANPSVRLWAALALFLILVIFMLLIAYLRLARAGPEGIRDPASGS